MTRDEFVKKAIDAGLDDDSIKLALNDRRKSIGAFDDESKNDIPAEQPKETTLMQGLFPRTMEKGGYLVNPALDVASLAGRAISSIGEGGKYLENLARKEAPERQGLGGGLVNVVENTFRDPATIPSLAVGAPLEKAIVGAGSKVVNPIIKTLTRGATEGATSAGVHAADKEGYNNLDALKEMGINALIPTGVTALGSAKKGAAGIAKKAVEEGLESGGIDIPVMKMAGTKEGQEFLKANKGRAYEIGQKLVDQVYDPIKFLPESNKITEALPKIKGSFDTAIQTLESHIKKDPNLEMRSINSKINEQIDWLKSLNQTTPLTKEVESKILDASGKPVSRNIVLREAREVTGQDLYNAQKQIDEVIADRFGKDSDSYINALKDLRHSLREEMRKGAIRSGQIDYIKTMDDLSDKFQILDKIKSKLGSNQKIGESRAESFTRNLFGEGKSSIREAMKDYDKTFGSNIYNEAEAAHLADFVTDEGKLPIRPPIKTGYSKMDFLSLPIKSPRIAGNYTLPLLEKLSSGQSTYPLVTRSLIQAKSANDRNEINPALGTMNLKR